ncbi:MAG: asparagine--tRNA ligase [Nanoarchaeota archaeon]|nr:asparagine--tRNA ligase [Nanoarchaeota archaeon]MBU1320864.1 asparagine--tRNA ligase [Nanoarchaeota archaeon]MBU1598153.1 asparagine--tRNA ligase [Nanoarchaeota archaeon]MBU2441960.1 asparagine--tRNA ligase [Nanoarchaeota archaeon]
MKFISIKEAMKKGSGKVSVRGWVHRERGSNKFKFIVLRDATDLMQCVIKKEKFDEKKFEEADKLQVECSMYITGTIKADKRAPTGFEIEVDDFTVIGWSDSFPLQADQSREFMDDNRHLALRTRKLTAVMKIRHTVFGAFHEYFRGEGFYEYQSPIFQSVQCEGGSTLFGVKYFDKKDVFLAQTWQLYAEPAIFSLEKIYTMAPSFRAEKSKTSRHLTEYWHAEMEVAWSTFKDLQDYGEGVIKHAIKRVLEKNQEELKILERDPKKLEPSLKKPFVRMTYTEALKLLKEKCKMDVPWGKDMRTIEEDKLSSLFDVFIICTHYPKEVKAFYMMEDENDPKVVLGADFIAPEGYGEIIGCSQREHDIEKLKKRLRDMGENPDEYDFYLDTRKYGSIPHGGWGMGMERLISWMCGLDNIKDAIPFPRTPLRYKP